MKEYDKLKISDDALKTVVTYPNAQIAAAMKNKIVRDRINVTNTVGIDLSFSNNKTVFVDQIDNTLVFFFPQTDEYWNRRELA